MVETRVPAPIFVETARSLARPGSDLETAVAIGGYIAGYVNERPDAIRSRVTATLAEMRARGVSYCSDVSQVFVGLAIASHLSVREWTSFFDDFGGRSHVFNEIFDRQREQWVMVDALRSFIPFHKGSQEPMSVLEFRDALAGGREETIEIRSLGAAATSRSQVLDYYRPGTKQLALTFGNDVFTYEELWRSRMADFLPIPVHVRQGVSIALGEYPLLVLYPTERVASRLQSLATTRLLSILLASVAFASFGLIVALTLGYAWAISRARWMGRSLG